MRIKIFIIFLFCIALILSGYSVSTKNYPVDNMLNSIPGFVCLWNFNTRSPFKAKGKHAYRLQEGNGKMNIVNSGVLSASSLKIEEGQYLYIPRKKCGALNIYGKNAQVTILAWIKRQPKKFKECEAIAGMWNETNKKRQYCMFLNLNIYKSADQVCGHISGIGGPTAGQRWCMDASIGQEPVPFERWQFVAFTYDGILIKSYLNGELDSREGRNPYKYTEGIFNGSDDGADFTVGAVNRSGKMGNFFVGQIGGLAIYKRALDADEIRAIYKHYPLPEAGE